MKQEIFFLYPFKFRNSL